jgi:hypothetical protein
MAVTRAQVNAGKAAIIDRLFIRYPHCRIPAVRIAIQLAKGGNATQREVARGILQEAYTADTGRDPFAFPHNFKQWLREALDPALSDVQTTGIDRADAFEPEAVTVT